METFSDTVENLPSEESLDRALQSAQIPLETTLNSSPNSQDQNNFTDTKAAFGSPASKDMASPELNPSKQLDFGAKGYEPATPSTPIMVPTSANPSDNDEVDYNLFIKETLLWTNKIRSSFYFGLGILSWWLAHCIFNSRTTLFTGVCYSLLASLAFNFLRAAITPKYAEKCIWVRSSWTQFASAASTASINAVAAVHDRHMNGLDALRTLEVGLGLWVLSLLGRYVDAVTLLLVVHVAAFTLPLVYTQFKTKIDATVSDVTGQVQAKYEALDRKVRATMILVPLVLLMFILPSTDKLAASFIALVYARAMLKPAEYAEFQKKVEPLATGVKNIGNKAINFAGNTINKYDLTPTPSKKKVL